MKKWVRVSLVIIVLLGLIIFAGTYYFGSRTPSTNTNEVDVEEGDIRVAAVGDSITYGLNINDRTENSYPSQLDDLLGEGYAVGNFGESNYSVQSSADFPYETTNSFQNSLEFEPDIVIFMMGTNDTKSMNWEGEENFKQDYLNLLENYQDLSSVSRIILAAPPRVFLGDNVSEGSIDPDSIENVRNITEEIALKENLEYVDIYEMTYEHSEWFPDDIHPNAEGASELADIFYEQIKSNE